MERLIWLPAARYAEKEKPVVIAAFPGRTHAVKAKVAPAMVRNNSAAETA